MKEPNVVVIISLLSTFNRRSGRLRHSPTRKVGPNSAHEGLHYIVISGSLGGDILYILSGINSF